MKYFDPVITVYALVVVGLLGLVMGSFINCWAWRSVHGESIARGRSHCPSCGHELGVLDLVPVLSWLLSGGRCRYCKQPISVRYLVVELVCAVVFVGIVWVYGPTVEAVELLAFSSVLLFLSLTDMDSFVIPNKCIVVALVVRGAYLAFGLISGSTSIEAVGYFVASGLGMGVVLVVITLIGDKVLGRESMGGGDLKLYAVAGFYFGWQQGLLLIMLSCVIGIAVGFVGMRRSSKGKDDSNGGEGGEDALKKPFPFGPSIAVACVITMFVGNPFISWYLGLL